MKIDYLEGNSDTDFSEKIIRIHSFSTEEISGFSTHIALLSQSQIGSFAVGELGFAQEVNCKLSFGLSAVNKGVYCVGNNLFQCDLTTAGYAEMLCYMEPFTQNTSGFQFIADPISGIELLLSNDGFW